MGDINTSGCYYIAGELFACEDGFGGINLNNIALINGLPPGTGGGGAPQSPWLSNINGGGFSLSNVNNITAAGTLTGGSLYINNGATILGTLQIANSLLVTNNITGGNLISNGCFYIGSVPFACSDGVGGIALSNISTINGQPPGSGTGGENQTPWLSDIDGANYALTNVNYINANDLISAKEFDIYGIPFVQAGNGPGAIALYNIESINGNPYPPPVGQLQTPWLSNIDASSWFLSNVGGIGINRAASAGYGIYLTGSHTASIAATNTSVSGFAGLQANTPSVTMYVGVSGNSASLFPGMSYMAGTSGLVFSTNFTTASLFIASNSSNNNVGVKNAAPAYDLDVTGNCNISGQYLVNGSPLATGQNQTPWLSNINAQNFGLYSLGGIGIGQASAQSGGIAITNATSSQTQITLYNSNSAGAAGIGFTNNASVAGRIAAYGSASSTLPNSFFIGALNNYPLYFGAGNGNVAMTVYYNGNVGIGTTNPIDPLVVNGAIRVLGPSLSTNAANSFVIDENAGNARLLSWGPNTTTLGGFQFISLHSDGSGAAVPMVITPSGILGVGTGQASQSGDLAVGRPSAPQTGAIYFGANGTTTGYIYFNGSTWAISPPFPSSGIAGISGYWSNGGGGTGPYGGAGYSGVQLNAGSNMSVACAAGSNPGVQTVIFTVGYISDMRLKDYAEPLQGGIDVVLQIHPIYAQWNGLMDKPKGKAIATVSAQELQVVMPYAVDPIDVQLDPEVDVTTEILSYDPVAITLQCVLAIQQLVERIEKLESRIEPYIH